MFMRVPQGYALSILCYIAFHHSVRSATSFGCQTLRLFEARAVWPERFGRRVAARFENTRQLARIAERCGNNASSEQILRSPIHFEFVWLDTGPCICLCGTRYLIWYMVIVARPVRRRIIRLST